MKDRMAKNTNEEKHQDNEMKKFCVFSGFLGSGKTTTMIALTKYYSEHYGRAAMISNDLGHGVDLADDRLARLSGCEASEITDECICFIHDELATRLDSYYDSGCELVISDIPGFGVGALEHVYFGLDEKYPGKYELGPFTVITEPEIVDALRTGRNADMRYIRDFQLKEADLIVLNKCDCISEAQSAEYAEWLKENYPYADVAVISALTGTGLDRLAQILKEGRASLRHPDIDYESEELIAEMDSISEYYIQYYAAVCCNDFDGNDYLLDMAEQIRDKIHGAGFEVPHLKLLAWHDGGEYGKIDLIGTGRGVEKTHLFDSRCINLAVILNCSAACPADLLDSIITGTVKEVSADHDLELFIHKKECFNLGE